MELDARIPVIAGIAVVVCGISYLWWQREKARLHQERGYDAADPTIDKEAWENTRAKLRGANEKGRLWLEVIRGCFFAPVCALLAVGFTWAGLPSQTNPALRWDMMGISALAAIGGWFMGRSAWKSWRELRSR